MRTRLVRQFSGVSPLTVNAHGVGGRVGKSAFGGVAGGDHACSCQHVNDEFMV